MRKRIAEITILASFLATLIITNRNTQCETYNSKMVHHIVTTAIVEKYDILSNSDLDDLTEEIRNEILYGELEDVALLVYAEAGNQDELGQRYVADVVFNRVDSSKFPDNIYDVIYQKKPEQFTTATRLYKYANEVPESIFQLVLEEYSERTNNEILYFRTDRYGTGTPAFKHGDHYFSTK